MFFQFTPKSSDSHSSYWERKQRISQYVSATAPHKHGAEQNSINQFTDSKAMLINALCANVQNNEDCLTFIELFDVIYACRGTTWAFNLTETVHFESSLVPFHTKYRSLVFTPYVVAEDNQHTGILRVVRDLRQGVERQVPVGEALSKVLRDKNAGLEVSRHFSCQNHLKARVQQVLNCRNSG